LGFGCVFAKEIRFTLASFFLSFISSGSVGLLSPGRSLPRNNSPAKRGVYARQLTSLTEFPAAIE